MSVTIEEYVPKLIKQQVDARPRQSVTHDRWKELWNLTIEQGDYTAEVLREACLRILAAEEAIATLATGSLPDGVIDDRLLSNAPEDIKMRLTTHINQGAPHAEHETLAGAQARVNAHANETAPHSATSAVVGSRLILRDTQGRAQVATPVQGSDIATKQYVDGLSYLSSDRRRKIGISSNPPTEADVADIWIVI